MLFIYSIELCNPSSSLQLHDRCRYKEDANKLLHDTAITMIRRESGDRRAESAFKDDIPDSEITEDGYFLRHSSKNANQIDVFKRTTTVVPGRVWGATVDVVVEPVSVYGVCESSLGLPIEYSGESIKRPEFTSERQSVVYDDLITELKNVLNKRKQVRFSDHVQRIPTPPPLPVFSDSESEGSYESIEIRVRPPPPSPMTKAQSCDSLPSLVPPPIPRSPSVPLRMISKNSKLRFQVESIEPLSDSESDSKDAQRLSQNPETRLAKIMAQIEKKGMVESESDSESSYYDYEYVEEFESELTDSTESDSEEITMV